MIKYFESKVKVFQAGCLKNVINIWKNMTTDPEILNTISGLAIDFREDIELPKGNYQYPFSVEEAEAADLEIEKLIKKG